MQTQVLAVLAVQVLLSPTVFAAPDNERVCRQAPVLLQTHVRSSVSLNRGEARSAITSIDSAKGFRPFHRFCGIASNTEAGNEYSSDDLMAASSTVESSSMWHYNWKMTSEVRGADTQFVPMIKEPGHTLGQTLDNLPAAGSDNIGHLVKGWNEPDDHGQAGHDWNLRSNPENFAKAWTEDMLRAKEKGYTEFVSPAMAHDVCWLDYFLKGCEATPGCKDLITYLAFHRYRADCGKYKASPDFQGWREDLGYLLSFYRLQVKYNKRGFNIKGLVWDEMGCFNSNGPGFAPEPEEVNYIKEWYEKTLVQVKMGDAALEAKIKNTPWIMPVGPDAHSGQQYTAGGGFCHPIDGGTDAGRDAVLAIRSLVTVAWFSIEPKKNHLFRGVRGGGLSWLGTVYFSACRKLAARSPEELPTADDPVGSEAPGSRTPAPSPEVGTRAPTPSQEQEGEHESAGDAVPTKVPVRLVEMGSGKTLFAKVGSDWGWGFGADSGEGAENQWSLVRQAAGGYRIVNEASGRELYAAPGADGSDGVGAGSSVGSDGVWEVRHAASLLQQEDFAGSGSMQFVNKESGRCLSWDGSKVTAGSTCGAWGVERVGAETTTTPSPATQAPGGGGTPEASDCERCPVGECDRWSKDCFFYEFDVSYHCKVASCADVPAGASFSTCWTWEGRAYYNVFNKQAPCKTSSAIMHPIESPIDGPSTSTTTAPTTSSTEPSTTSTTAAPTSPSTTPSTTTSTTKVTTTAPTTTAPSTTTTRAVAPPATTTLPLATTTSMTEQEQDPEDEVSSGALQTGGQVCLKTNDGKFVSVFPDGAAVTKWGLCLGWEHLVVDVEGAVGAGRSVRSGDSVKLRTHTQNRLAVTGSEVRAVPGDDQAGQLFSIFKHEGQGPIRDGDEVYFKSQAGALLTDSGWLLKVRVGEEGVPQRFIVQLV